MKIINIKTICKTLLKVVAIAFFTQAAYAEVTLKLGTTGLLVVRHLSPFISPGT